MCHVVDGDVPPATRASSPTSRTEPVRLARPTGTDRSWSMGRWRPKRFFEPGRWTRWRSIWCGPGGHADCHPEDAGRSRPGAGACPVSGRPSRPEDIVAHGPRRLPDRAGGVAVSNMRTASPQQTSPGPGLCRSPRLSGSSGSLRVSPWRRQRGGCDGCQRTWKWAGPVHGLGVHRLVELTPVGRTGPGRSRSGHWRHGGRAGALRRPVHGMTLNFVRTTVAFGVGPADGTR